MSDTLTFLHLSDIHFAKSSEDVYDLDKDLRNQLEQDVRRVEGKVGSFDGILVSGDIAFSGKSEEYHTAMRWLARLCEQIDCQDHHVWVAPGNHDVQRNVVSESKLLKDFRERMRDTDVKGIGEEIGDRLRDPSYGSVLFEPVQGYVSFAARFQCEVDHQQPYWDDTLDLNDGSLLRLRGLNSTLISDGHDDEEGNKLVLGQFQAQIDTEPDVTNLVLCHHPPDWLRDRDIVTKLLNQRASLQLYGHKHIQSIQYIEQNDCSPTIQMCAGAVHPQRNSAAWLPRYNVLSVRVLGENDSRILETKVYPRTWQQEREAFGPDSGLEDKQYWQCHMDLPDWQGEQVEDFQENPIAASVGKENKDSDEKPADSRSSHDGQSYRDAARQLAYRFLTLSFAQIVEIGSELNLLADDDEGLHDFELFKKIFDRAKEHGTLAELWEAVEESHGNKDAAENPYRTAQEKEPRDA